MQKKTQQILTSICKVRAAKRDDLYLPTNEAVLPGPLCSYILYIIMYHKHLGYFVSLTRE